MGASAIDFDLSRMDKSCLLEQFLRRAGAPCPPGARVVDVTAVAPTVSARASLTKWLAMVAIADFHDLRSIVAIDAVYHSPVEWHPYPGRDLVCLLVRTAASVFEDFEYLREFAGGDEAVLEFSARRRH